MREQVAAEQGVPGSKGEVLVVGASFAGLATAWWMHRLGYRVTVAEIAPAIRRGGTPVDIRESVIPVARSMGLLERIAAKGLPPRPMEFLDRDGAALVRVSREDRTVNGGEPFEAGYEIERNDLLNMLYGEVERDTEFVYGESVEAIEDRGDHVWVRFTSGAERDFALVFGCDGVHSAVRRIVFGPEAEFSRFLNLYFSLTIVDELLIPENTSQMFNLPGRTVMLNGYNGKTDIGFAFYSEEEIAFDRRDAAQQKRMMAEHFEDQVWRMPELVATMERTENFYFDKLCQIRMGSWVKGRVALVGDAGYCPSPAAGMGGSMALLGAASLGEAFGKHPDNVDAAMAEYDRGLRAEVERIQREAVEFGLAMFAPRTEAEIEARNARFGMKAVGA